MATVTLIPSGYTDLSGMTIDGSYPITNAYANSSSTNYARFNVNQSTTGSVYLKFDTSDIPSTATNISITGNFKARVSNTTRVSQTGAQLYSGSTAKGTSVAFGATTASVRSLSPGNSWTRADLNDLRLYVTGRASSSSSSRRIDFYGADITITYTAGTVHVTGVEVTPSTASIEVGETVTLTATVSPSDATNKTVTWTTSASSVATVSDGVVTGVSAGTARITATTQDGGFTDYCDVTVTPAVTYEYVPASSMEVGKDYLISIGNSGSIYLLTDESGGSRLLKGVSVTVVNGKISITGSVKSKALFSCVRYTAGNDVTITVEKDNKYLYCDNSTGLRMNAPATLDRFWHYRDNKFWQFKNTASDGYDDTSTEYKYYLQMSGTNFTDNHVTSPSIEESTLPEIYIWKESTGQNDKLWFKGDGGETLVGTDYSSNYDAQEIRVTLASGIIVPGDTVRVVLTNIRGWNSGSVKVRGSFEVEFERDSVYGGWQYAYEGGGSSGTGVVCYQAYQTSNLEIRPYSTIDGQAAYDGQIDVYKVSDGGWIEAIKVYKKVNGSWVEQVDLTTVFDANTNYVKG